MSNFKVIIAILSLLSPCTSFTLPFNQRFHLSPHPYRDLSVLQQQRADNAHEDFESLTVAQLKDELKKYELKVSGKKSELIQRLTDYMNIMEQGREEDDDEDEENDTTPKIKIMKDETKSFSDLNLIPSLQSSIEFQGWEEPTPIQKLAIPTILHHFSDEIETESSCTSIWAEAPTGSGKTGAFALPLIQLTLEENKKERNRRLSSRRISQPSQRQQQRRHQRHLGRGRSNGQTIDTSSFDEKDESGGVTTLILCPTRELTFQIGGVIEELIESMTANNSKRNYDSLNVVVVTGGVPMEPQIELLASKKMNGEKIDILVATPGRLADVLQRADKEEDTSEKELEKKLLAALDAVGGKDASLSLAQLDEIKINEKIASGDDGGRSAIFDMLSNVKYLVLDEADRLLSQGFKKEVDGVLKLLPKPPSPITIDYNDSYESKEVAPSNDQMKTLLFSATFPEQIQPRVEKVLRRLSSHGAPPPIRLSCALAGISQTDGDGKDTSIRQRKRIERTTQPSAILEGPASTIQLRSIRIEERDRTQALRRLINEYGEEQWDRVLIFVSTRYASEHVAKKLRRYNIKASELHGKLDQDARIRRLEDFKKGKTRILVATDLASRGLDVVGLPAVVNYDLPRSTADFTHRIGRTGRAGKKGMAVTFITPTNEDHYNLIEKRQLKGSIVVEREVLKGFEPNENKWEVQSEAVTVQVKGVKHSNSGLAHDRMFGGIKGRRKNKKDKLREKTARVAAANKAK